MAITPTTLRTPRKISLGFLLKTLDKEWDAHTTPWPEPWEDALFAYYHGGVRIALHWVDGDPYTYKFPRAYEGERLARLCGYLRKLELADPVTLITERDKQVNLLRDVTWPAYEKACAGMCTEASPGQDCPSELTYTWDGIDSLWSEHDAPEDKDAPPPYLPKFHAAESEAFHCNVLAVLFLNRAAKYQLSDIDITPF